MTDYYQKHLDKTEAENKQRAKAEIYELLNGFSYEEVKLIRKVAKNINMYKQFEAFIRLIKN